MQKEPNINDRSVTVLTSSTLVAEQQNSGKRTFISFVNTSILGEIIYLSVGSEAKIGKGFPLSPGGFFLEDESNNVMCSQKHYTAIATAATATLAIQERTITGDY